MSVSRRHLLSLAAAGTALPVHAKSPAETKPVLRAPRLKPGDTLGLISPAHATYEREPFQIATEARSSCRRSNLRAIARSMSRVSRAMLTALIEEPA